MKYKLTITIGIPAYNEDANIKRLLFTLLGQNYKSVTVEKIIVNSDGSKDKTTDEVNKIKDKRIILLDNKENKGQAFRQNEIIKKCLSDILILLNADVAIIDKNFIKKLILPITLGKADFTSSNLVPQTPSNFFERVLYVSVLLKNEIYGEYNNGDHVLTCHGAARAFSKKYYSGFSFKTSVGEDAYSYFYGKSNGLKYSFCKNAILYFRLPDNISDHEKQSVRFFKSQKLLAKKYGELVTKSYRIPAFIEFSKSVKYFLKYPIEIISYLLLLVWMKIKSLRLAHINNDVWTPSASSKYLK